MSRAQSLLRTRAVLCLVVLATWCLACAPASGTPAPTPPTATAATATATPVPASTIVSLTFDDGLPSHLTAVQALRAHGMAGTFYISPDLVGTSDYYLTWPGVAALADAGGEIGGHTLHHVVLSAADPVRARREACGSRTALQDRGFGPVSSFAYPDAVVDPGVERIVAGCGFASARGAGGLAGPSCRCPYAETLPPADPLALRTPVAAGTGTTLADLQAGVVAAEEHGGGWVPLVFHGICDDRCADDLSVSPAIFGQFLGWLAARGARGTVVRTVGQVMAAGAGGPR